MQQTVNANRMNLMRLRKRWALATRGHTLLKQKLDELMHLQQAAHKEWQETRGQVEDRLNTVYSHFILGSGLFRGQELDALLAAPLVKTQLTQTFQRLLNFRTPQFGLTAAMESPPYGFLETNSELDVAVRELKSALNDLVRLAQQQRRVELLAHEIKVTRRRVNALEYILIPSFEERIHFIQMKLDENERADINRLMRIKSIIRKEK